MTDEKLSDVRGRALTAAILAEQAIEQAHRAAAKAWETVAWLEKEAGGGTSYEEALKAAKIHWGAAASKTQNAAP